MRAHAVLIVVGMFAFTGCGPGKLHEEKTITVDAGDTQYLELPKQPKPQKITVEFDAPSEVDVFVVDVAKAGKFETMTATEQAKAARASKTSAKSGTVTADVPENTEVKVAVTGAKKKTDVKVLLTNQK